MSIEESVNDFSLVVLELSCVVIAVKHDSNNSELEATLGHRGLVHYMHLEIVPLIIDSVLTTTVVMPAGYKELEWSWVIAAIIVLAVALLHAVSFGFLVESNVCLIAVPFDFLVSDVVISYPKEVVIVFYDWIRVLVCHYLFDRLKVYRRLSWVGHAHLVTAQMPVKSILQVVPLWALQWGGRLLSVDF